MASAQLFLDGARVGKTNRAALPTPRDVGPAPGSAPPVPMPTARDPWAGAHGGDVAGRPGRPDRPTAPAAQPVQVAQAGVHPEILFGIMSSPWASDEQRPAAQFLLQQHMPARQTAEERAFQARQAEAALRVGIEDHRTKQEIDRGFAAPTQHRSATPEEAAAFGATSGQFGPDGRFYPGEDTIPDAPSGYRCGAGGNLEFSGPVTGPIRPGARASAPWGDGTIEARRGRALQHGHTVAEGGFVDSVGSSVRRIQEIPRRDAFPGQGSVDFVSPAFERIRDIFSPRARRGEAAPSRREIMPSEGSNRVGWGRRWGHPRASPTISMQNKGSSVAGGGGSWI